jgi:hypothetical protein
LFLINKNNSELINKNKKNNIIKQNNRIIKNNNLFKDLFCDNINYKKEKILLNKNINNIKLNYYQFDEILIKLHEKFCINYLCLIAKKEKNIKFTINNIKIENIKIILYNVDDKYIVDNKLKLNNFSSSIDIFIDKLYFNSFIFIIFTNNNSIVHDNKFENIKVYNHSKNNLFVRKINDNVRINNLSKNILIDDFLNNFIDLSKIINYKIFNLKEHSNILFANSENLYLFYIDYIFFEILVSKYNFFYYKNNISILDLFSISYNIVNNCNLILFTNQDWSNTAYRYVKSLKEVGVRSLLIKTSRHKFNYPFQGIIINNLNLRIIQKYPVKCHMNNDLIISILDSFKYIWFHASTTITFKDKPIINYLKKNHNYIVAHGGSTFRIQKNKVSSFFNGHCSKSIIQCPDLLKGLCNNEKLIYYPLDTKMFIPHYSINNNKLIFSHYPSTKNVKGSDKIFKILNKFKDKIIIKSCSINMREKDNKDWLENIGRYKECDVYIETLMPKLNGLDFGEWGNTCLEAASSGCIVITNCTHLELYKKNYKNDPPILISNSMIDIEKNINYLLKLNKNDIINLKKKHRKWVDTYHNLKYTGKLLKEYIF